MPTYLSDMTLKASAENGSSSAGARVICVSGSSTAEPCGNSKREAGQQEAASDRVHLLERRSHALSCSHRLFLDGPLRCRQCIALSAATPELFFTVQRPVSSPVCAGS